MRKPLARIERLERAVKTQSKFSADCICFPETEEPQLAFDIEYKICW